MSVAYRSSPERGGSRRTSQRSPSRAAWLLLSSLWSIGIVAASTSAESTSPATSVASEAMLDQNKCESCHLFEKSQSHPIDVAPSLQTPASLPLTDGRITCLTCHDSTLASGHSQRARTGRSFLRSSDEGGSLCSQCHETTRSTKLPHATNLLKAHLTLTRDSGSLASLDSESVTCMSCHDGATASDAGSHHSPAAMGDKFPADHPIGISLEARNPDREEGTIKPVRSIDKRVRLFRGTVGCGSCHSVYSKQADLLVMSNQRSALCQACHEM